MKGIMSFGVAERMGRPLGRRIWHETVALVVCGALLAAPVAAQQPTPDTGEAGLEPAVVVLEVYVRGQQSAQTPEYRDLLSRELLAVGRFALMAKDDASRLITAKMLTPAKRITSDRLEEIESMVSQGDKLLYTDPRQAVEILHEAKRRLLGILETISLDGQLRDELFKTQMLLARSQLDNGNEKKVRDVLREVILEFGDGVDVTEENYHPALVSLFRDTLAEMASQKTAKIRVESDPPGAEVYLNSRKQEAPTPATYEGLYPGVYHVQVRAGQMESMLHKVLLAPDGDASLTVDVPYEAALSFNKDTFGVTFASTADLDATLPTFAARLGATLQLDYVALTGVIDRGQGARLGGWLVDVRSGQLVRSDELSVKNAVVSQRRSEQLALTLSGADRAPDSVVTETVGNLPDDNWYENWVGWTLVGVGVAGVAVGAVFTLDWADKKDRIEGGPGPSFGLAEAQALKNEGETSGLVGAICLGIGGAALAAGAVSFAIDAMSGGGQPETTATPVLGGAPLVLPGGGGVSFGGTF